MCAVGDSSQRLSVYRSGEVVAQLDANIVRVYEHFKDGSQIDPKELDVCISDLHRIAAIRLQIIRDGAVPESLSHKYSLALQRVQEMNMASAVVTRYDVQSVASFFTPPDERVYIDPVTGTRYVNPDHSKLLAFAGQFFMEGGYSGIGLLRHQSKDGAVYDFLYLKKQSDQICYEKYARYYEKYVGCIECSCLDPLLSWKFQDVIRRMEIQKQLVKKAYDVLNIEAKNWRYQSYKICGYEELVEFDVEEAAAMNTHAIIFYYEKDFE